MYLTLAHRALCWITALPLLFLAGILALTLLGKRSDNTTAKSVGMVLALIFASLPTVPLLAYYFSGAARKRYQSDILQNDLHMTPVAEKKGVQWVLLAFPDRIAAPGVVVVTLFLQNAHSTPRAVSVRLVSNPFQRGGSPTLRQHLEGGEVGVLRIPLRVPESAPAARHELRVDVEVRREGRIGARVIRRDGLDPRRLYHSRRVDVEVLGRHQGKPLNEAALGWTPFQRLFVSGQRVPDLEPIRVLESL